MVEKGKHRDNYIDKVLAKCKSWGGHFYILMTWKQLFQENLMMTCETYCVVKKASKNLQTRCPNDHFQSWSLVILISNDCTREDNDKDVLLPTESKTSNDQNFSDTN